MMVEDKELTRQTIESVVNTNKGEWPLNIEEGITFSNIIGKNITDDMRKDEIQQGINQVNEAYTLDSFETTKVSGRKYKAIGHIQLTADTETTINLNYK